ncbi:MAG: hypothetical protein AAFN18_24670, partial [Cyanobacteria bacterium J06554_6]
FRCHNYLAYKAFSDSRPHLITATYLFEDDSQVFLVIPSANLKSAFSESDHRIDKVEGLGRNLLFRVSAE